MEAFLAEKCNLKQIVIPADRNAAAATGARVDIGLRDRVAFVIDMGDSTSAVASFTLRQHDAASAGTSKDLEIDNPYYHKAGAATEFTKVELSSASAAYDLSSIFADDEGLAVIEVLSEQVDSNNGFKWVSLDVADSTAAKVIGVVAITGKERYLPAYEQSI